MKLAIIGTGRMGKAISELAIERGHEIVLSINSSNSHLLNTGTLAGVDLAIEFTRPDSAVKNLRACLDAGIPVVCGTTGWHHQFDAVADDFRKKDGALLYASNFSIGVNLLFEMNRIMAGWMKNHTSYKPEISEIHHIHKLDKPSGTAVTLTNDILTYHKGYKKWMLKEEAESVNVDEVILIDAMREEDVVGIHSVTWQSSIDKISIYHEAFSRRGFVEGVLEAAQWLQGRKGVFTMKDLLFPSGSKTNS